MEDKYIGEFKDGKRKWSMENRTSPDGQKLCRGMERW